MNKLLVHMSDADLAVDKICLDNAFVEAFGSCAYLSHTFASNETYENNILKARIL